MTDKWFSIQFFIITFPCFLLGCASTDDNYRSAGDPAVIRGNDCVSEKRIRSYEILDDQNLIIEVAQRGNYHVELRTRVGGLDEHWSIQFVDLAGGICKGSRLVVHGSGGRQEIIRLSSIRKITPGELDALLIHYGKRTPRSYQTMEAEEGYGAEMEELD